MEDPRPNETADADERAPDFDALTPPDEAVRGGRTRDDFLDAALALDEPATAEEVAELAGHGVDAAREYLTWFERMGIVTRVTDSPATYERNRAYLEWRRVQRLRDRYATDDLLEFLDAETERDRSYADEFGVESPATVSISTAAAEADRSLEAVWEDVSAWRTTRRRIVLLERALATDADGSPGRRAPV